MEAVEVLKEGALVNLKIGGEYMTELQALIHLYSRIVPVEELSVQMKAMADDTGLSEYGRGLQTLLVLVNTIETNAKEQDLIQIIEIPSE